MILIIDRCFYLITFFNFSLHIGGLIGVQTNFGPILGLDKIIGVINAEQFPFDCLGTLGTALLIVHALLLIIVGLKIMLLPLS